MRRGLSPRLATAAGGSATLGPMRATAISWTGLLLASACAADLGAGAAPIIDGTPGASGPHGTVAIVRFVDGAWVPHCSGTLIASDVVLTAAHCMLHTDWVTLSVDEPRDIRYLGVAAGAVDLASVEPESLYGIGAARTLATYPYLDIGESPSSVGRADDVAVLVLLEPVTELEPVPLLPADRIDDALGPGATVILAGYGRTEDGLVGVLHEAETRVVERTDHEVLAGGPGVPDSCFGDSGGPGYVRLDGALHVWGVTSRGAADGAALCGDGGIYTLAPAYADWIAASQAPVAPLTCAATHRSGGSGTGLLALVTAAALAITRRNRRRVR